MSKHAPRSMIAEEELGATKVGSDTVEWPVWSTVARLVLTEPDRLDEAFERARGLLAEVDAAASRFREDSEIRGLDRAGGATTRVSPLFRDLILASLAAAGETEGDVDPCLGNSMRAIGYDRDFSELPSAISRLPLLLTEPTGPTATEIMVTPAGHRVVVSRRLGWRDIEVEGVQVTMPPGLSLDLGATAKAFASDWVARVVAEELDTGVLVSLGGDIATAGPGPAGGWRIRVSDGPGQPEAAIALPGGSAVATSSTIRRRWAHEGQQVHHILEPRTGLPARPVWRTVTVAAPSCVRANTLTTAAVVRGAAAPDWLRTQDVPGRLVAQDGVVTVLGGWPEADG